MNETFIEEAIKDIEHRYPDIMRPKHLIQIGLFPSPAAVSLAVKHGIAPPHIELSPNRIGFARASLCAWLRKKASIQTVESKGQK